MSIATVKKAADQLATANAGSCIRYLARNPLTKIQALAVKPNLKFFRRLAGLANGDLNGPNTHAAAAAE